MELSLSLGNVQMLYQYIKMVIMSKLVITVQFPFYVLEVKFLRRSLIRISIIMLVTKLSIHQSGFSQGIRL
jgi:hypothetical protein